MYSCWSLMVCIVDEHHEGVNRHGPPLAIVLGRNTRSQKHRGDCERTQLRICWRAKRNPGLFWRLTRGNSLMYSEPLHWGKGISMSEDILDVARANVKSAVHDRDGVIHRYTVTSCHVLMYVHCTDTVSHDG
jgi:hypothetical protein